MFKIHAVLEQVQIQLLTTMKIKDQAELLSSTTYPATLVHFPSPSGLMRERRIADTERFSEPRSRS